jgi:hypothetical protein
LHAGDNNNNNNSVKLRDDWRQRSKPIPPGGTYPAKDHCRCCFTAFLIFIVYGVFGLSCLAAYGITKPRKMSLLAFQNLSIPMSLLTFTKSNKPGK